MAEYQAERKRHADAIADLSEEHFHELRDRVGDPRFLLRKRIERRVAELLGDDYQPLYSLISFTLLPYCDAVARERRQRPLIDRLLAVEGIGDRLDSDEFDRLLDLYGKEQRC